MVGLRLDGVAMEFRSATATRRVLQNVTLHVRPGEVVAIRGTNGSGKTTLLNLVAGLFAPTAGSVVVSKPPENRSFLGFAQQDYTSSLLPWCDVLDNVALPLRLQGMHRHQRRARAADFLIELGFASLPFDSFPHQLSGGQRQRVAIARALVARPALLLLDEPFANLDGPTIRELQETLLAVQAVEKMTVLFVSHDLDSSIYLADKIALLSSTLAGFVAEVPVSLPHPRCHSQLISSAFLETRALLLGIEDGILAKA
jgi:NitT/TauT family transport system ATP-binding protein